MNRRVVVSALSAWLVCGAAGAQTLTPVIGGVQVHCTDAQGVPVFTLYDARINDSAIANILPNGMRIITLNPAVFMRLPPLAQIFFYAHECGHHISGDIIAMYRGHLTRARELNADRIGIRLLRDQFGIGPTQASALASLFYQNPGVPPFYLPGPMRSQWILNCYRSDDDTCTLPAPQATVPDRERSEPTMPTDDGCYSRCRSEENACRSEGESFSDCMQGWRDGCMRSCTEEYGNSEYECSVRFCNPNVGSNGRWERECRRDQRERERDCRERRRSCDSACDSTP